MYDIAIIGGCGHVGLPLGLAFARAGLRVVAVDLNEETVAMTASGKMPFDDRGADDLLPEVLQAGTFTPTTDRAAVANATCVVSVIGTPVDEHLNPRFDVIRALVDEYRETFRRGQLWILRSTLFPGTTRQVSQLLKQQGIEVDVAFCPERVAEGFALEEVTSLPQIVAGCTPTAQARAEELFGRLGCEVIPMDPLGAELTKLFNNAWRYIQFAVSNQFYMIANDYGIDFYDIHTAMTHNYPRAKSFPRAGFAAGPCLFKDTMQLSAFHNNNFFLGHSAMLVNEGLPNYLVQRAQRKWDLRDTNAGILGMTFKADSDDPRDSLSFKLRRILQAEAKQVLCADPYLDDERLVSEERVLDESDIIFIGVPHTPYRGRTFGGKPVIDIWNIVPSRIKIL